MCGKCENAWRWSKEQHWPTLNMHHFNLNLYGKKPLKSNVSMPTVFFFFFFSTLCLTLNRFNRLTKSLAWHWNREHGCGKTLCTTVVHTFGKLKARLFAFSGARILFIQSEHVVHFSLSMCYRLLACSFAQANLACVSICVRCNVCVYVCGGGGDADIFNVCFQFLCLHHYVLHTLCLHKSMANIWFVLFLSSLLDLFIFFYISLFHFLHVSVCVCVVFATPNHCCGVSSLWKCARIQFFSISRSFHLPLQVCVHPF